MGQYSGAVQLNSRRGLAEAAPLQASSAVSTPSRRLRTGKHAIEASDLGVALPAVLDAIAAADGAARRRRTVFLQRSTEAATRIRGATVDGSKVAELVRAAVLSEPRAAAPARNRAPGSGRNVDPCLLRHTRVTVLDPVAATNRGASRVTARRGRATDAACGPARRHAAASVVGEVAVATRRAGRQTNAAVGASIGPRVNPDVNASVAQRLGIAAQGVGARRAGTQERERQEERLSVHSLIPHAERTEPAMGVLP